MEDLRLKYQIISGPRMKTDMIMLIKYENAVIYLARRVVGYRKNSYVLSVHVIDGW